MSKTVINIDVLDIIGGDVQMRRYHDCVQFHSDKITFFVPLEPRPFIYREGSHITITTNTHVINILNYPQEEGGNISEIAVYFSELALTHRNFGFDNNC